MEMYYKNTLVTLFCHRSKAQEGKEHKLNLGCIVTQDSMTLN